MKMSLCAALFAAAMTLAAGAASADPGKDESGKGRWRGDYGWGESERKSKFFTRDGCEVERKWKKGEYEFESEVQARPIRLWILTGTPGDVGVLIIGPENAPAPADRRIFSGRRRRQRIPRLIPQRKIGGTCA